MKSHLFYFIGNSKGTSYETKGTACRRGTIFFNAILHNYDHGKEKMIDAHLDDTCRLVGKLNNSDIEVIENMKKCSIGTLFQRLYYIIFFN